MLNVAGGKLTTYRRIALEALSPPARPTSGCGGSTTRPWPLPGATGLERRLPADLDADVTEHLLHLYGGLAHEVLDCASDDHSLLERLHPDGPDIAAQVVYAGDARVGAGRRRRRAPADDVLLPRARRPGARGARRRAPLAHDAAPIRAAASVRRVTVEIFYCPT